MQHWTTLGGLQHHPWNHQSCATHQGPCPHRRTALLCVPTDDVPVKDHQGTLHESHSPGKFTPVQSWCTAPAHNNVTSPLGMVRAIHRHLSSTLWHASALCPGTHTGQDCSLGGQNGAHLRPQCTPTALVSWGYLGAWRAHPRPATPPQPRVWALGLEQACHSAPSPPLPMGQGSLGCAPAGP